MPIQHLLVASFLISPIGKESVLLPNQEGIHKFDFVKSGGW
jgi:hypothetical protein